VRACSGGDGGVRNASNMATCLSIAELCWGDVGLLLSMPRQGLGNAAIASVADEEQLEHRLWRDDRDVVRNKRKPEDEKKSPKDRVLQKGLEYLKGEIDKLGADANLLHKKNA